MAARSRSGAGSAAGPRGRCQCGHLATHHLVVVPVPGTASWRLAPTGPCQVCGEAGCARFTPATAAEPRQP